MTTETKVEAVAWQLIDADGKPAFMPYTNKKQADEMVAYYQDDTQLRPCDQEIFTIRELVPQSAITALEGEVASERERADKFMWQVRDTCARAEKAERRVAELEAALRMARDELGGLPHSLGYEFTHLPKIYAALTKESP